VVVGGVEDIGGAFRVTTGSVRGEGDAAALGSETRKRRGEESAEFVGGGGGGREGADGERDGE
jgi:hypothetical protein